MNSRDDLIRRGDALDAFRMSDDPERTIERLIPPAKSAFSGLENPGGKNVYSATVHLSLRMDILADNQYSAKEKAAQYINAQHHSMPEIYPDMVLVKMIDTLTPEVE